ncbi:MAG: HPr kinase/phosphatase C-terminal domain-containing protein [Natronohydrobacter sp.]|nr:HPr kinase/phosphatase C-terminal domain-containing protein [Natronohydrobacter sp.]
MIHGSAVAFDLEGLWTGLLIKGRSGSGKSELALELIGLGARLVSDDQTELRREGAQIRLSAPPALRGLIELRQLGILRIDPVDSAALAALVDLDELEAERLPQRHVTDIQGVSVPRLRRASGRAFAVGLKYYLLSRHWQDKDN